MNRTIDNPFYMGLCHNMKMQKNVCLYICFITTLMHLYVNDLCFDWLTLCQVNRGTLSFQKILHYFPLYGFFKIKTTLLFDVAHLFLSTAVNLMAIVIYISTAHMFTSVHVVLYELVYVCSGIGRETPEDTGIATKTADGDS